MTERPAKTWRLNYWKIHPDFAACVSIFGAPAEVRLQASDRGFIAIKEDSITLSGGTPSIINIQGMSSSLRYAGMLQDTPWPLSMLPSTMATPIPKQIINPPFKQHIKTLAMMARFASMMRGG